MMIKAYDFANRPVEIELFNKKIKAIYVAVISGDEVIQIIYEDDSCQTCDSSLGTRIQDALDGIYQVKGEKDIQKWINFKPRGFIYSYERMMLFN